MKVIVKEALLGLRPPIIDDYVVSIKNRSVVSKPPRTMWRLVVRIEEIVV